jgi:hypothetical protein
MSRFIVLLAVALVAASCATPAPERTQAAADPAPTAEERGFAVFAYAFEGIYDTVAQEPGRGESSPARLRVTKPWPDRRDEMWRLLEYSTPGGDGKPFLQRLYRFRIGEGEYVGTEFEVPATPLAAVKPESLRARSGCNLRVQKQMEALYAGGTVGEACPGEGGAARRHFDFYLSSSSIRAWDRGYDRDGRQVSGPKGPWEFRK